ncbi:Uncharacterised protein [uncultured archaeon]|nr:Uncharacterised protein [uncultured archaeon]
MAKEKDEFEIPLYAVAAMFVVFVVLFYYVQSGGISTPPSSNSTPGQNLSGNIEGFQSSLLASDEMAIVMNVTGLESNYSRYVYACGAGLAGSWGKLGKNVSNLHIYVLEGDACTYSNPLMSANTVSNETESRTSADCMAESSAKVAFEIRYGPGYSIFTDRRAYIFVDENFEEECSFRTSDSSGSIITTSDILPVNYTEEITNTTQ